MKKLMKRVCVIVSVGIVFAQSVFVFFNLRANSRHISQHFAALNMKEEVSREITTTEQGLRQAKHFPSSHREKIASEVLEPVAMEENLFPVQKPTYEECLLRADDEKLQFHELVTGSVIYSAFLDFRFKQQAFIRLISFLPAYGEIPEMYCHFMDLNTYEFFSSIVEVEEFENNHGEYFYHGFISSCELPEEIDSYTLCSVNISLDPESHRQTSENTKQIPLHLVDRRLKVEPYSLCVPPIGGDIPAARLVEFIELSQILGVSHITFYNSKVEEKTLKILRYYKQKGLVTILPWEIQEYISLNTEDNGKTLALNDCMYRNLERFDYVGFNNLDEFIIPFKYRKTPEMFQNLGDEDTAGYCFQIFTFDTSKSATNNSKLQLKLQLLTQTFNFKASSRTFGQSRCVVSPKKTFYIDLNAIINPTETYYTAFHVEPNIGSVLRYGECIGGDVSCESSHLDLTMVKYRDELKMRFNLTMGDLKRHGLV